MVNINLLNNIGLFLKISVYLHCTIYLILLSMKKITVKKIACGMPEAEQVGNVMDDASVCFNQIDIVNWTDYSYRPDVKFRIAHTGDAIMINYRVTESSVRAIAPSDQGRVWEDSCCEFFVCVEGEKEYYNFECNCAGTLLVNFGKKGDRHGVPEHVLHNIKRWSSLGREPFEERIGNCSWELSLVIPVTSFFNHDIKDLSGVTLRGNFYKCGDLLQTPHFLSWNPIDLPQPCFHCPEFFGTLAFED